MADFIQPDDGDITRDVPAHTVWTRPQWDNPWTEQSSFFVNDVFWGSGPQMSSAQLSWTYGVEIKPGETAFQTYSAKDLLGQYVKIQINQQEGDDPLFWYGVLIGEDDRRGGALLAGGANPPRILIGEQLWNARGLDYLFLRTMITTSIVRDETDGSLTTIERGLTFNAENSYANAGNRSPEPGPLGVFVFAKDLDDADYWTTKDILDYLLKYQSPRDLIGTAWIDWSLDPDTSTLVPTWDRPVIATDGVDLRSIINQLLDPRRLLSWTNIVEAPGANPDENKLVRLSVFSFNQDTLLLPSGGEQQANSNQVALDFDRALDVTATLRDSDLQLVEQVIVKGARRRSIVTLSYQDGTLEKDWSDADETAYEAGVAGIGALDIDDQERRIRELRADERFERVYQYFRLPSTFAGLVGDGIGGALEDYFPDNPPLYIADVRFERSLPKGFIQTAKTGSPNMDRPPFGLIKLEDDGTSTDRYQFIDKLNTHRDAEGFGEGNGRQWSCSLRMQPDSPGVIIHVSGGNVGPEAIALTDFAASATRDKAGELDWQDILITVMLALDGRMEEKYPEANPDPNVGHDVGRTVILDYGDKYRLDYVPGGTVIGHDDGVLQFWDTEADGFLRDDREALQDIARFAFEWFGVTRQAFSFGLKQVYGGLTVGQLITTIGADETLEDVNSAVTGVRINMRSATTQVTTMFPALDFKNL